MRYVIQDLRFVDYEFECEALADFKFGTDKVTNKEKEEAFVRTLESNACEGQ